MKIFERFHSSIEKQTSSNLRVTHSEHALLKLMGGVYREVDRDSVSFLLSSYDNPWLALATIKEHTYFQQRNNAFTISIGDSELQLLSLLEEGTSASTFGIIINSL